MRQHLKGQQQQLGDNEPQLQKQLSDRVGIWKHVSIGWLAEIIYWIF